GQSGYKALHRFFSIGPCERSVARHYRSLAPDTRPARARQDLLVVISTRNNEAEIAHLIRRVHALVEASVLVVDNRSTDATCHEAEQCGARV
ncbi:hypothetical protein KZ302_26225, partial [Escherichia coli]